MKKRTMTQLKFAGGMRLLRKKSAAEAIVQYDDMAKNLIEFGNRVKLYMGIVRFYNVRLAEMQQQSSNLIKTLKGEYEVN